MHLLYAVKVEAGIAAVGIILRVLYCERQGVCSQGVSIGDNEAALHDIAQFTDIPFPRIPFQDTDIVRRDRADGLSYLRRQCGNKRLDMQRNVVHPFAERRQVNMENRKPVNKSSRKWPSAISFAKSRLVGGYHTHIHLDRFRVSNLEEFTGFENTE